MKKKMKINKMISFRLNNPNLGTLTQACTKTHQMIYIRKDMKWLNHRFTIP